MNFHQIMQPRQRSQFQAVGEFLYIDACPESVSITTERGDYRLKQGAQIIDPQLAGRVTVENMGEAGAVTIICGYGRYVPPSDGQQVAVTQMPAVTLSPNQMMNIGKLPQVALVDGQAVIISQLPKVELEDNQQVTVSQLPEVSLAAGQQVAVTELPRVKLESGQAVRVYATTPMLTKPVGGENIATSELAITEGIAELASNTSRCHVLLKASSTNADAITLGSGWTLAAGEQLKLETTAALSFAGTDGDAIQIIEVTR
ncbi:hypothetical protein [Photobacterium lutimaris]|uniref:Uncharacterized protein n=1 Tax=Photobacterium lutimaris TaxID=388278 RepID=A0A2T3J0R9_9GAMM|nr:hypothetical protein [Photobacterium lutimaris]PSU34671.1 hypothetical protein C9I99_06120 [Photobacterium lutimaris]TDR71478.1 hypothetical protein DFP78_11610 [Photobacterium lutimaris]